MKSVFLWTFRVCLVAFVSSFAWLVYHLLIEALPLEMARSVFGQSSLVGASIAVSLWIVLMGASKLNSAFRTIGSPTIVSCSVENSQRSDGLVGYSADGKLSMATIVVDPATERRLSFLRAQLKELGFSTAEQAMSKSI